MLSTGRDLPRTALSSLLLLTTFLLNDANAQPSTKWRDYRIIGTEQIDLGSNSTVPGNYVVLGTGGSIRVQNGARQPAGTPEPYLLADEVTLSANASVQNVYANRFSRADSAEVVGTIHRPAPPFPFALDDLPSIPPATFDPCTTSAAKTVVPANEFEVLSPGCYGELEAKQFSTVTLTGGEYRFLKWDLKNDVTVNVLAPSVVHIRQNLSSQQDTEIAPASGDPDDLMFFIGADSNKSSSLGGFNVFVGNIVDPFDRELNLRRQISFTGTAMAIKVKLRGNHQSLRCGDGVVNPPAETCDPPGGMAGPNDNDCRDDCTMCGDGIQQDEEQCDDGNSNNDDGCRNDCSLCGDGVVDEEFGELCDGDASLPVCAGKACKSDCTCECGDGILNPPEECEVGIACSAAGETCDLGTCMCSGDPPDCGDGKHDPLTEKCDPSFDPLVPPIQGGAENRVCRAVGDTWECTFCGDGMTQSPDEKCDDGNDVNEPNGASDQCRNDCTYCGDGTTQSGEGCDDGNDVNEPNGTPGQCRNDCTFCGDGILQAGEKCDDGNDVNEPNGTPGQCRNDCSFCGDGMLQVGEQCDPGIDPTCPANCQRCDTPEECCPNNPDPFCLPGMAVLTGQICRSDCTACGDGQFEQNKGEGCDDGNAVNEPNDDPDQCRNDCSFCGDGRTDPGEGCDDGNDIDDDKCSNDCRPIGCGDGVVQGKETCDPGPDGTIRAPNGEICRAECNFCGDGMVDRDDNGRPIEACDDGNRIDDDECNNQCGTAICGDGIKADDEDCEPPLAPNGNPCRAPSCTYCGNGVIDLDTSGNPLERCDDGNDDNDDECRNDCSLCGDGVIDREFGETCDEGTENGNGFCREDCTYCGDDLLQTEHGEICDGLEGVLIPGRECRSNCTYCGDGIRQTEIPVGDPLELCDDGNDVDDDDCNNQCVCPGPPTEGCIPPPECGDGLRQGDEQCDDGNKIDGDGCDADCTFTSTKKRPWGKTKHGLIGDRGIRRTGPPSKQTGVKLR